MIFNNNFYFSKTNDNNNILSFSSYLLYNRISEVQKNNLFSLNENFLQMSQNISYINIVEDCICDFGFFGRGNMFRPQYMFYPSFSILIYNSQGEIIESISDIDLRTLSTTDPSEIQIIENKELIKGNYFIISCRTKRLPASGSPSAPSGISLVAGGFINLK